MSLTMTEKLEKAVNDITNEYIKASNKHQPIHSPHEGYAVILEELDELKAEIWKRQHDYDKMTKEAIQVGAMAMRFLIDVCYSE